MDKRRDSSQWMNFDRALVLVSQKGPDDCWIWPGDLWASGYGRLYVAALKKQGRAHRVSYERFIGPIPEGKEPDHLCRNRACFNPRHLEIVTHKVNMLRSPDAIPAKNARKTHCKHGHPFDAANTRYMSRKHQNGRITIMRVCRACVLIDTWIRRGKLTPEHRDLPLSALHKAFSRQAS